MQILFLVMIMMNKKRICIFLALILCLPPVSSLFDWPPPPRRTAKRDGSDPGGQGRGGGCRLHSPASGENREQRYYLVVEDGYLSVYYGADRTFYAYTDIRYDMLDEATRQQIQQGLSFTDERTLYDFLENHSS